MMPAGGWIGVDLDGTLAVYDQGRYFPEIGPPIPRMVERVKRWIAEGKEVRIFTARVAATGRQTEYGLDGEAFANDQADKVQQWVYEHIGTNLQVTCQKDFQMTELWDDRCVQMISDMGYSLREQILGYDPSDRDCLDV